MMRRRLGVCAAAAVLLTPLFSSCSDDENKVEGVTLAGENVKDPGKVLSDAWNTFSGENQSAIDKKSATVADGASCFFRRDAKESTAVLPKVFCGPIKRVGSTGSRAWDIYGLGTGGADSPTTATQGEGSVYVTALEQKGGTVDTSLLVRMDDKRPSDPKKLAAPKAPRTDKKDFAVLAPEAESGFDLKNLDKAGTMVTPSATIKVEAQASRATIPSWVVAQSESDAPSDDSAPTDDSGDGSGGATEVRPAEGQSVKAYRISIGPGPRYSDHNTSTFDSDGAKDASTELTVGAGGQQLSIRDQTGDADDSYQPSADERTTFTVECESLPCSDAEQSATSYLLVTSHAKGSKPNLTATVDGQRIVLPLDGSKPTASVSQVLTKRKNREQQVNATFPETKTTVKFDPEYDSSDQEFTFSGGVPNAFLTSFDRAAGWAPKGKAWLEVPLRDVKLDDGTFDMNYGNSFWIKVGDKKIPVRDAAGADGTLVFEVPDDFTKGTLTAQPQGTVKGYVDTDAVTKKFKQAKALTVPISVPAG